MIQNTRPEPSAPPLPGTGATSSEHEPDPQVGSRDVAGRGDEQQEFLRSVVIDGVRIYLPEPVTDIQPWLGKPTLLKKLAAAWTHRHPGARSLHPVLIGEPQIGKTTLSMAAARLFGRGVWIFSCDEQTEPQDLLVQVVLDENGAPRYMGSAIVAAMVEGGSVVLDDASRLRPRAFSSLIPVLDFRGWADSVTAGVRIHAAPGFRICFTMNDAMETHTIPRNIQKRLGPWITVRFPETDDLLEILLSRMPDDEPLCRAVIDRLQQSREDGSTGEWSVNDAIGISEYLLNCEAAGVYDLPRDDLLTRAIDDWFGLDSPARDRSPGLW